jgi:hypothetical protein
VAPGCPGLSGVLGGGQGVSGRGRLSVFLGAIRGESPDLPPPHPERRWATGAVVGERSPDQATSGGRGLGADGAWSDGAPHAADRVAPHPL